MQVDYTFNDTGSTGTPALPMDIHYNRGDLYDLDYRFEPDSHTRAALSLYGNNLNHSMNNYELRQSPPPGNWRRNDAGSDTYGFKLQADLGDPGNTWVFGVDGLATKHNSDIDNPNNAAFFLVNFNAAERGSAPCPGRPGGQAGRKGSGPAPPCAIIRPSGLLATILKRPDTPEGRTDDKNGRRRRVHAAQ